MMDSIPGMAVTKRLPGIGIGELFYVEDEEHEGFDIYMKQSKSDFVLKGWFDNEDRAIQYILLNPQSRAYYVEDYYSINEELEDSKYYRTVLTYILLIFILGLALGTIFHNYLPVGFKLGYMAVGGTLTPPSDPSNWKVFIVALVVLVGVVLFLSGLGV